jgi:hypothetical protein
MSASDPTSRLPSVGRLISFAGFHVDNNPRVTIPDSIAWTWFREVLHPRIHAVEVEIGRDRIGIKPLRIRRNRNIPIGTTCAVAQVENDASFPSRLHHRIELSALQQLLPVANDKRSRGIRVSQV